MAAAAPDPEDLTARARIRDAAVRLFGELGFERTTFRAVAAIAGVAPSLVRHHFGSKQGLRQACDEQLIRMLRRLDARVEADGMRAAPDVRPSALGPYQRYLGRALSEGAAGALFDEFVRIHERWLAQADAARPDEPQADLRARAAVRTAMTLSIAVLHEHVARSMDADLTTPEGEARLLRALLEVHSHPLVTPREAAAAREALHRGETP
ncbi:TetR/AcrR family transcriptional regulator [Actinomadura luzonensis]|uniref:TetR/AcrR family transcriptional regulator n=1 Tax=Actinomadura luzonensis TaxID=2805427 RepID=UPI00267613DE|nr:TetR/AcrR family transcriptional regulator [Actinomadura luzonensis]